MEQFVERFVEYAPLFLEATWLTLSLTATALVMAMPLGAAACVFLRLMAIYRGWQVPAARWPTDGGG